MAEHPGPTRMQSMPSLRGRGNIYSAPRSSTRTMLGTQNLLLFVASGILLNLTPGQDTFYILGRSVAQGRRAGIISVLGIITGSAVHTCAAAFGLSAILATSANAGDSVKARLHIRRNVDGRRQGLRLVRRKPVID